MFEPSGFGHRTLFAEALAVADIIKYSGERLPSLFDDSSVQRSPLLEIQTLGSAGLRYRVGDTKRARAVSAIPVDRAVDTAGAGDWCTAGLLHSLVGTPRAAGKKWKIQEIREALRLGQSLASLSCAYVGSRGMMYAMDPDELLKRAASLPRGDKPADPDPEAIVEALAQHHIAKLCSSCSVETSDLCLH
jgi:fructokinase